MAKEILLYNDIYSQSASEFINSINEASQDDIVVRIATDGGDPQYTFGMVAKFSEHQKEKKVKVDGKAYSGGSFFCLYSNDVECLNVSQFLFHRAAYPDWFEKDPTLFTEPIRNELIRVNANLRAAMEAKLDIEAFQKISKVTIDELFSMDKRVDVFLNAKEAKKVKLVDRIIDITPQKKAEIESRMRMAAKHTEPKKEIVIKNMTLAELKTSHPEVYAQAVAEGVNKERDRVGSWLPYLEADTELVSASIKEGKDISMTAMSELNVKMFAKKNLAAIEAGNPKPVTTPEVALGASAADAEKQQKEKSLADFRNEARASLGLPALK